MYSPRVLTGQSSLSGSLLNKWAIQGNSKGFGMVSGRAFLGMNFGTSRIETCLAPDGSLEKVRLWSALARSKLWMVSSWRGVGRLRIFRTLVMANRQHNVREIFGRNSSGVGLRYKWFPLRIVNIAWRISHWIGCHVHYMDSGKLCCRRMFLITATRPDPTGVGLCGTEADDGWEWSGTNPRPVVVYMVVHLVATVAGAMAMTDAAMLWESPSWERLELEKCI